MLANTNISMFHKDDRIVSGTLWLIKLRWLAVLCIIAATLIAKYLLNISLKQTPIFSIAVILSILNVLSLTILKNFLRNNTPNLIHKTKILFVFQIVIDLIMLTVLLHFSGGIENPIVIYYIFHMIIVSILLPPYLCFIITSFALALICTLTILEYRGIIPHYNLTGFNEYDFHTNKRFLIGTGLIFITTSYLVIYMTLSISSKLRRQEELNRKYIIELEKKDTIKNEYVLRITHDIKDHLLTIQRCLDAFWVCKSGTEKQDFIQRAQKRTRKLASFTQNLLKLTRMRLQDRVSMSNFNFENSVKKVTQELSSEAFNKGIKIISDVQTSNKEFIGDQLSIEEAIYNILNNAIKYSHINGEIIVQTRNLEKAVLIEVIDNGIGIPKQEQKQIFNEFYRASNVVKKEYVGDGFGLSLVQRIVENHKGKITIESKQDYGSKVSISFPYLQQV